MLYLNDVKEAFNMSKKALILFPRDPILSKQHIECLAKNGQIMDAIELLRTTHILQKKDHTYHELISMICKSILAQSFPISTIENYINHSIIDHQDNDSVKKVCRGLLSDNLYIKLQSIKLAQQFPDYCVKKLLLKIFATEDRFFLIEAFLDTFVNLELEEAVPFILKKINNNAYTTEQKMSFIRGLAYLNFEEEAKKSLQHEDEGYRDCFLLSLLERKICVPKISSITPFLKSSNVCVQFHALALIAQYYSGTTLPLNDSDHPYLQMVVVWQRALQGDLEAAEKLFSYSMHQFSEIRYFSAHLLSKIDKKLIKKYGEKLLNSADPLLKVIGAKTLIENQCSSDTCYQVIHQFLLTNTTPIQREGLFHPIFSHMSTSKTSNFYGEIEDLTIRWSLYLLLGDYKNKDKGEILKRFIAMYKSEHAKLFIFSHMLDDPEVSINKGPYEVLHRAHQELVIGNEKKAFKLLSSGYPIMKAFEKNLVIQIMSYIRLPEAIEFLLERLEDPFISIKVHAASSLIKSLKR